MSFASIKAAIAHVFGVELDKAHSLVEAVITDAAPLFAQLKADVITQVGKLIAEGHADAAQLLAEAIADVKADIADVKNLVNPAPVATTPPVTDPAPAAPSA